MKTIFWSLLITVLLLSGACSTKITNSWQSDAVKYPANKYKKIIIVSLVHSKSMQKAIESKLVKILSDKGVYTVSYFQIFGHSSSYNENRVIERCSVFGADAVLTVSLLNLNNRLVSSSEFYTNNTVGRPSLFYIGNDGLEHSWADFYGANSSSYNLKDYFFESKLYDLKSKAIIYSVQVESYNPPSLVTLANNYSKAVSSDMTKHGIFSPQ